MKKSLFSKRFYTHKKRYKIYLTIKTKPNQNNETLGKYFRVWGIVYHNFFTYFFGVIDRKHYDPFGEQQASCKCVDCKEN